MICDQMHHGVSHLSTLSFMISMTSKGNSFAPLLLKSRVSPAEGAHEFGISVGKAAARCFSADPSSDRLVYSTRLSVVATLVGDLAGRPANVSIIASAPWNLAIDVWDRVDLCSDASPGFMPRNATRRVKAECAGVEIGMMISDKLVQVRA